MKNSLKKLRGLGRQGNVAGGDHRRPSFSQLDDLALASQDMKDMRDCYDSLLSAAAATANSAYEFSESLREFGACLLEKTALNDDEDSGRVLLMLGKIQFQLQKLVDTYRSHIFQTITVPSESLLNELQTLEEMKQLCDEKRDAYEYMLMKQRERGRGRNGKGESFSVQQIQAAHDDYDEEATLFVFRLKSLKQGQSRCLLTQAARHHAAQLCFFKKALTSLEAIEPHVKSVTEQQHIDYHFSGLDDGDEIIDDDDDDDDTTADTHDDGELSFEHVQNGQDLDRSMSTNKMELDMMDITFPQVAQPEVIKENIDRSYRKSFSFRAELRAASQSAPLFAAKKLDSTGKVKQLRPSSTRKFHTYVLPTPVDSRNQTSTGSGNLVLNTHNISHSSPLDPKSYEKLVGNKEKPSTTVSNAQPVLTRSNNRNTPSIRLPSPLSDSSVASDFKKIKRYAFSGPIARKQVLASSERHPQLFSGPLLKNPISQVRSTSPNASPSASPTFMSSPKISELHELPRPPSNSRSVVGYSAPIPKGRPTTTSKPLVSNTTAAPLPTPSQVVTRSFSIPSSGLRAMALNVSKPTEATSNSEIDVGVPSPPLTPITLSKDQSSPTRSGKVN